MPPPAHQPAVLSPDLIGEILAKSVDDLYSSPSDADACNQMVSELTADQLEQAARTSYAYYVASTSSNPSLTALATDGARRNVALRMARRHLVQCKGNQEKAAEIMVQALEFRNHRDVDALRNCFAVQHDERCASLSIRDEDMPDADRMESYRKLIVNDLAQQPMVVRGHDVSNRAVLIKFPRISAETDVEAYVMAHLYVAERAMAATEVLSRGNEEKIVVCLDFADYSSSCKPPLSAMRMLLPLLQVNYPERVDHIVIVEPSLWMRALFKLLGPFFDPHTKEKIVMVNGEKQRIDKLQPLVSKDQAMPFMLPGGELTSEVNVVRYLEEVPFFSLYDFG